uniref:Protoheme IX farnesyltransferase, mitochondrial n=1 Tax=Cladonia uncialis subsp. uncialis TaxID=180999 RepID=A0A2K9YE20_CLAUC|nr:putative mitochondria protoheme IX farnseyltransferase [Cladonia uncialis subsp. uncialis]
MLFRSKAIRPVKFDIDSVCIRCLLRLTRNNVPRRHLKTSIPRNGAIASNSRLGKLLRREYFSANLSLGLSEPQLKEPALSHGSSGSRDATLSRNAFTEKLAPPMLGSQPLSGLTSDASEPPHRRRKRLKAEANGEAPLPLDASSRLSTLSSTMPAASLRRLLTTCLSLSKPRLSFLIVLTTATAYSLYPVPALLLPATTASPSLSALTLVFLTSGTSLCCASANALNMLLEPKFDAQMSRTRNRPLVRGLIGKKGALIFASVAGVLGVGSLWFGVNPTTAFLGGLNIAIYAGVYTPMKRISVLNTWIGALVGGIPPLMGWAAAAGQSATGAGDWRELLFSEGSIGGWLLAGLLFAWQFPHFNSLSWPIREEYRKAGYRMLVWTNSRMNGRVALRYAILCFPICVGLWWFQITDQGFLVTSSVINGWMVTEAWKFWRKEGHKGSARGLFWASVWHLPVVMVLAMLHKKGLWEGIWKRVNGEQEDDVWPEEEEVFEVSQSTQPRLHLTRVLASPSNS